MRRDVPVFDSRPSKSRKKDDLAPFESPRLLIESANDATTQFATLSADFIQNCGAKLVSHFDFETRQRVLSIRLEKRIPSRLRTTAYHIISDLRHALDQAVCDSALELGRKNAKGVYFPFAKNKQDFERQIEVKCKGVHPGIVRFIEKQKPYLGGNDYLWALSRMAGPNKHQKILHMSLQEKLTKIDMTDGRFCRGPAILNIDKWHDEWNQLEIARVGEGGYLNLGLGISVQIVMGEVDVLSGAPAAEVFKQLCGMVEAVVDGIVMKTNHFGTSRKG